MMSDRSASSDQRSIYSKETVPFICVHKSIRVRNDQNAKFPHWEHEGLSDIQGHPRGQKIVPDSWVGGRGWGRRCSGLHGAPEGSRTSRNMVRFGRKDRHSAAVL